MTNITPEAIKALAALRVYAATYPTMGLSDAINALDNAGVFADLDEQTDYASAEDILAEAALASVPNTLDPAEWGDTTSADVAVRQGLLLAPGQGFTQDQARALFGDGPEADAIRPARARVIAKCLSCGLRVADGSEYHASCRPA